MRSRARVCVRVCVCMCVFVFQMALQSIQTGAHPCVRVCVCVCVQRQLALDLLSGELGSSEDQTLASKVVRLVIAGGCLGKSASLRVAWIVCVRKLQSLQTGHCWRVSR